MSIMGVVVLMALRMRNMVEYEMLVFSVKSSAASVMRKTSIHTPTPQSPDT